MTKKQIIKKIEKYVKETMAKAKEESHGFRHVDRVRKWALKIGRREGGVDLFLLEVSALLHDIGKGGQVKDHYAEGAKLARRFLGRLNYFSSDQIERICRVVYEHGRGGESKLSKVLQDADRLDLWGAIAVARAFTSHYDYPYYNNEKSFQLRKFTKKEVDEKIKKGLWNESIVDHLANNLAIYDHSHTKSAKKMAQEKVNYLKNFLKQLKKETIDL